MVLAILNRFCLHKTWRVLVVLVSFFRISILFKKLPPVPCFTLIKKNAREKLVQNPIYWASEASPTLGCSIEISRDIYIYICIYVVGQINCVGGITWTKHVHAQSLFFWQLNQ